VLLVLSLKLSKMACLEWMEALLSSGEHTLTFIVHMEALVVASSMLLQMKN